MSITRLPHLLVALGLLLPGVLAAMPVSFDEVMAQPSTPADLVIAYGTHPDQVAELRLPHGPGPHPVVVLIHGGCWMQAYGLDHLRALADAITGLGFATWNLEYRRPDGETDTWPQTFADAALGLDELRAIAEENALDLSQLTVLGHSAGGQIALWLAARPTLDPDHPLAFNGALPVDRVLALAPITDVAGYASGGSGCAAGAIAALGGSPELMPERYEAINPIDNLPLATRVELVHPADDGIVPLAQSEDFAARFAAAGGQVEMHLLAAPAGHFDVVMAYGPGWELLQRLLQAGR